MHNTHTALNDSKTVEKRFKCPCKEVAKTLLKLCMDFYNQK